VSALHALRSGAYATQLVCLVGVNGERLGRYEVQIPFDRKTQRPANALQFAQAHVPKLRASQPEVAEPEAAILIVWIEFREQPRAAGVGA
jgi:hypothetical protein